MTNTTKTTLTLLIVSTLIQAMFPVAAWADVDGNIGVIGFSADSPLVYSSVGKIDDFDDAVLPGGGAVYYDYVKPPVIPTPPPETLATAGSDTLRLLFDLLGPAHASFVVVAIPADAVFEGIEDLEHSLAMVAGRFDENGEASMPLTVTGTPEQLAQVEFVVIIHAPQGSVERDPAPADRTAGQGRAAQGSERASTNRRASGRGTAANEG